MVAIDLHTHSILSHDGGLHEHDYEQVISSGKLQYVAITDHNEISFALRMREKIGSAIIVGEEIMTKDGEIIGLFLREKIEPGLSAVDTVEKIKQQKGLVYIPHPFETVRSGISQTTLSSILENIDIIETFNGRGMFRNKNNEVGEFISTNGGTGGHSFASAASSDAHCVGGIGTSYSVVEGDVTRENIVAQLGKGQLQTKYAPMYSLLCPKMNVIKKYL